MQGALRLPARGISSMGKERVDAGDRLRGIVGVNLILGLVAFFRNREKPRRGERFVGVSGSRMTGAEPHRYRVDPIGDKQ